VLAFLMCVALLALPGYRLGGIRGGGWRRQVWIFLGVDDSQWAAGHIGNTPLRPAHVLIDDAGLMRCLLLIRKAPVIRVGMAEAVTEFLHLLRCARTCKHAPAVDAVDDPLLRVFLWPPSRPRSRLNRRGAVGLGRSGSSL